MKIKRSDGLIIFLMTIIVFLINFGVAVALSGWSTPSTLVVALFLTSANILAFLALACIVYILDEMGLLE